jgi:insertion element IS1 protein InsB
MLNYQCRACQVGIKEKVVEMSYVGNKANQRWLWYAVDHATNIVLAYVFGKRKDEVFQSLKTLLEPYNIVRYYPMIGGAYQRHLEADKHEIGKRNTQKIERKNLTIERGSNALIAKPSAFQNWNYCMIPLSVYSSIRSSLGLIFMRDYRFDPLPLISPSSIADKPVAVANPLLQIR